MSAVLTDNALSEDKSALHQLKKRWVGTALLCLALLAAGGAFLQSWWPPAGVTRWLILSAAAMGYLLWVLWQGLPENHRSAEARLLPAFGAGNSLTLLRGLLIALLAGFLFSPRPQGWLAWIPGLLYTFSVLMDYLDGYLARVTHHATRLGERLDMSLDGSGVLVAALLVVQYGQAPRWYLLVALARYLYLAGLWMWRRRGNPVVDLRPSAQRRAFAGLQMGFLAVLLLPVFSPPGTHLAAVLFALPFLAGFARDWLTATGLFVGAGLRLAPTMQLAARWTPVALRLAVAGLIASPLAARFLDAPAQAAFYASRGMPSPGTGVLVLGLLEAAVLALLLLGAAGRIAAIAALCLLGVNQVYAGLTPAQNILAALYTAILYLGTGALSLWKPEDRFIHYRGGENVPYGARPDAIGGEPVILSEVEG